MIGPSGGDELCDLEAEASVLGGILLDREAITRVADRLDPDDFYRDNNGDIYRAALNLHRADPPTPIDNVTMAAELERMRRLKRVGGRAHLALLQESVPTAANIEHYAAIVRRWAEKRRRKAGAAAVVRMIDDPAVSVEDIDRRLAELSTPSVPAAAGPTADSGWPAPLADEAFHGLAGRIVRVIEPTTEADPAALLLQLLVFFGSAAGRQPHFVVEDDRHGLNEYLCLVGATSKGRKGTSEGRVRALFRAVDENWLLNRVKSGLSTGEGFIWEIRDPVLDDGKVVDQGVEDKRLLCFEGELASILRRAERDGNSLSAELRLAWDGRPLGSMVKTRPGRTIESHVSVIGHVTRDELTRYMTRTEAANGFGNRFLWTCVRRARELPFGGEAPNLNAEVKELHEALEFARELMWPISFDEAAAEAWAAVYGPLSAGKPGLVGAILGRAEAHARRLAAIYAVLDQCPVIALDHLMAALAVWDYCEASARYIFGDSLGDPDADEVLDLLKSAGPKGLTLNELHEALQRNWPADRKARALRALKENGLVREERAQPSGKPGRPAVRYFAEHRHDRESSYLALAMRATGYAINAGNAKTPSSGRSEFTEGSQDRLGG
ncbi:MAG TPA: DnaB-like helicase N-terminal domain-containing protein, partial [Candidatus Dormibacteraeota bacterium]|nr:DnaB-like helicase N-terminal domain-containing protein [Candidatus Dormibacteraeota bacterium]